MYIQSKYVFSRSNRQTQIKVFDFVVYYAAVLVSLTVVNTDMLSCFWYSRHAGLILPIFPVLGESVVGLGKKKNAQHEVPFSLEKHC